MTSLRIVSLLPSATEIVAALGLSDALVGRSHECDAPPDVARLPVCTQARLDPAASTEEIHRDVQRLLADALSVYRVDADRLRELRPTHVITQVQCAVCAVSLPDVESALGVWSAPSRPTLVTLDGTTLEGVLADVERVASSLGVPSRGTDLCAAMRRRRDEIARRARSSRPRPRVATIEWLSPLMAAGNWIPELVDDAGGQNLFGRTGEHSPWLDWERVVAADPDVLIVFPCGFSLPRVRAEIRVLTSRPGFEDLSATRSGRVYLADGNGLFNRPGPRLVESLECLAEMLHPELFPAGHEGAFWQMLGA